jgi:sec-independent protein translocase protein TatA
VNGYPAPVGYFQTPWHIILLLVIALLLFGGKRLPEIGKALGSGMREFKDAVTGNSPSDSETQPELPAAQPTATQPTATVTPTTATPPERETV